MQLLYKAHSLRQIVTENFDKFSATKILNESCMKSAHKMHMAVLILYKGNSSGFRDVEMLVVRKTEVAFLLFAL